MKNTVVYKKSISEAGNHVVTVRFKVGIFDSFKSLVVGDKKDWDKIKEGDTLPVPPQLLEAK